MIPEMVRQILRVPGLRALGKIDYLGGQLPERYDLAWAPAPEGAPESAPQAR